MVLSIEANCGFELGLHRVFTTILMTALIVCGSTRAGHPADDASLDIREIRTVSVLTPNLTGRIAKMRLRYALWEYGCLIGERDHGPWIDPGFFPRLPIERHRVFTGVGKAGTYNHHAQLAKFQGRYYLAWSNSRLHEAFPGQRTMLSVSENARDWSEAREIAAGDAHQGLLRRTLGLYVDEVQMVVYTAATHATVEPDDAGSRHFVQFRIDSHVSNDGTNWVANEGILKENFFFMEAPRKTRQGHLLAGAVRNGKPIAMLWEADNPAATPQLVDIPQSPAPFIPDGETSWYQLPSGRIVMWFRDEGYGLRLFVATSDDGGASWTEPMQTDFPDSTSRIRAGRLTDGRYFLIGNSFSKLLDRQHLMITLSNNGTKFDRMYSLLEDTTTQRAFGLLKLHGFQYPIALEDGNRLLIAYSVNKEDIEVATLDLSKLE